MKKILGIAISLIIFLGTAAVVFGIYNMGKSSAGEAQTELAEMLGKNGDKYAKYENMAILGNELYEITCNSDGVNVTVKTGEDASGTTYPLTTGTDERKTVTSTKYINPYATFTCTAIERNKNGIISKLTFVQN